VNGSGVADWELANRPDRGRTLPCPIPSGTFGLGASGVSVRCVERRIDKSNIDLDEVALSIEEKRLKWVSEGLDPEPLTWTDNDEGWPFTRTLRADVRRPRSLGLRVNRSDQKAGMELVVYAGGWADLTVIPPDPTKPPIATYVELDAPADLDASLDQAITDLCRPE
jgi:hypothetical protein